MKRWPLAIGAALLFFGAAVGGAVAGTGASFPPQMATSGCQAQNGEPDSACTPGAVFPGVTAAQVCVSGYATSVRAVTVDEKRQVYAEYGLSYPQASGAYEVDHLVPLELGGSNDIANLWPEAAAPTPGFQQKDGLEDWLHDQVCGGDMALADAQQAIASDWLSAWEAAGEPDASYSAGNAGDSPNTIASLPVAGASAVPSGSDGHTWYASTASNANTIYCDTDPDWQRLSSRNLATFQSLAAAEAALPSYHLHKPC